MSQRAFLAEMDSALTDAFVDAGMADIGMYSSPDGLETTACRVYVDRNVQAIGEFNQITAGRCEVTYVRADAVPVKGGRLVVDGDTYVNVEPVSDDGSLSRWLVRRG